MRYSIEGNPWANWPSKSVTCLLGDSKPWSHSRLHEKGSPETDNVQIIEATFRPFSSKNGLPERVVPDLLTRFSSAAGYKLYPDVLPFFKSLRQIKAASHGDSAWPDPIVGVITNSDDRVPSILSSFGLRIGVWRHGNESKASFKAEDDINFVMLSYDVGFEKPDASIFDATKQMVPGQARFLHTGDDLQKDYYAAQRAGWEGFLLVRDVKDDQDISGPIPRITNLQELAQMINDTVIHSYDQP